MNNGIIAFVSDFLFCKLEIFQECVPLCFRQERLAIEQSAIAEHDALRFGELSEFKERVFERDLHFNQHFLEG